MRLPFSLAPQPVELIITLDVILFGIVTLLLEVTGGRRASRAHRLVGQTIRAIVVNPIIMATFLGILFGLAGVALPEVVDRTLGFIGQAAPPTALFALGATLSLRKVARNLGPAALMVGLKLFLHPLVVWVLVTQVIALEPFWAHAAVLFRPDRSAPTSLSSPSTTRPGSKPPRARS